MTAEVFLNNYDPALQSICHVLRNLVKEVMPQTDEIVFEGWKNISYGTGKSRSDKDLIVYIAPFKDSVNLGFFRGALLPDEKKLLKGTGKLLRHVKVRSLDKLDLQALKHLLEAARIERLGIN